jgi:hypothetical protein
MHGDPVCTNSPWSPMNSCRRWSGIIISVPPLIFQFFTFHFEMLLLLLGIDF